MDTRASSHLADNTGILTFASDSSIYPSVFVGNGDSIPVTHMGHSFLHTSDKPLHLNHILVTPHIIKNLISISKFSLDNDVSVEFDAYGFSIKVTRPTSSTTWHRRLSHPRDDALHHLLSSHSISYNKSKSSALCHACQLGKHVKLPFYSSESNVEFVFQNIHSDLWTSPIPSKSGIKYYAIFLDHFSHFV
ncbi:ribonuclease H-like domain-containing protein [Tanacetum coccineum]|uniref:Ribonuclease H-like domain-containing protein n=1 Tax=Tanacetum coccineum TaxID=301880 RepID=A0ABQ5IC99_9ASTR